MTDVPRPELSVVVALISGRKDDLARCLAALSRQKDAPPFEVIVPWDPPCREVAGLAEDHPGVRFLPQERMDTAAARRGAGREHHDALRTAGIRAAAAPVIALTEDHAVPSETWCADMVRCLGEHPEAGAVGGAVECGGKGPLRRAVYYCDFGRYQNPVPEGPAEFVSDSNVAYRREALEAVADSWRDDYHETMVHNALRARGRELVLVPRSLVHQVRAGLTFRRALRERIVWGRSYAGTRVREAPLPRRLVYAGFTIVLPALLTWRILSGAFRRRRERLRALACSPMVLLLQCFWALGEFLGYVTGDPGSGADEAESASA